MCCLRNIAMRDYQESVTTGQMDGQTDARQSDPYVPLCFAGDTKIIQLETFNSFAANFRTILFFQCHIYSNCKGHSGKSNL